MANMSAQEPFQLTNQHPEDFIVVLEIWGEASLISDVARVLAILLCDDLFIQQGVQPCVPFPAFK